MNYNYVLSHNHTHFIYKLSISKRTKIMYKVLLMFIWMKDFGLSALNAQFNSIIQLIRT